VVFLSAFLILRTVHRRRQAQVGQQRPASPTMSSAAHK
jgi:hypothetical protein